MIELLRNTLLSVLVSAVVSGLGVWYLQEFLKRRSELSAGQAKKRREEREKGDIIEAKRRKAAGRMFFWLHDAVVKGPEHANGDLEKAFDDYNAAEEEQKAFERELLAEHRGKD